MAGEVSLDTSSCPCKHFEMSSGEVSAVMLGSGSRGTSGSHDFNQLPGILAVALSELSDSIQLQPYPCPPSTPLVLIERAVVVLRC